MQIQSFWTINSAYLNGETCGCGCPGRLLLPPNSHFFLFESHQGHQIVVISRNKAADTGSLLTHFICLALGLLSVKQMERNCIISRVEWLLAGYRNMLPGVSSLFSPPTRDSIREAWPPWHVIYPDWLVLSARLLVQPSCGQVKIVQYIYIYMFGRVPLWLCEDITANCYMYCYFRNS